MSEQKSPLAVQLEEIEAILANPEKRKPFLRAYNLKSYREMEIERQETSSGKKLRGANRRKAEKAGEAALDADLDNPMRIAGMIGSFRNRELSSLRSEVSAEFRAAERAAALKSQFREQYKQEVMNLFGVNDIAALEADAALKSRVEAEVEKRLSADYANEKLEKLAKQALKNLFREEYIAQAIQEIDASYIDEVVAKRLKKQPKYWLTKGNSEDFKKVIEAYKEKNPQFIQAELRAAAEKIAEEKLEQDFISGRLYDLKHERMAEETETQADQEAPTVTTEGVSQPAATAEPTKPAKISFVPVTPHAPQSTASKNRYVADQHIVGHLLSMPDAEFVMDVERTIDLSYGGNLITKDRPNPYIEQLVRGVVIGYKDAEKKRPIFDDGFIVSLPRKFSFMQMEGDKVLRRSIFDVAADEVEARFEKVMRQKYDKIKDDGKPSFQEWINAHVELNRDKIQKALDFAIKRKVEKLKTSAYFGLTSQLPYFKEVQSVLESYNRTETIPIAKRINYILADFDEIFIASNKATPDLMTEYARQKSIVAGDILFFLMRQHQMNFVQREVNEKIPTPKEELIQVTKNVLAQTKLAAVEGLVAAIESAYIDMRNSTIYQMSIDILVRNFRQEKAQSKEEIFKEITDGISLAPFAKDADLQDKLKEIYPQAMKLFREKLLPDLMRNKAEQLQAASANPPAPKPNNSSGGTQP